MLDSLGELANRIGGNLKSMLPAECQSFNGPEGPFNVTLFEIAAQLEIEPGGGSHYPR